MKKNLFKLFTDKVLDYPLWVKLAVYRKLYLNLQEKNCETAAITSPEKILAFYEPLITFEGENELKFKKNGFDNNLYNFLKLCHENYNILEISLNTFLSLEETAKIFMFCIEQKFVHKPEEKAVYAMCGFLSGKFRTGEYFKEKNVINEAMLKEAIKLQQSVNKPLGELLTELNYVTKDEIKNLFEIKSESKKRFILDASIFPECEMQISEREKLIAEITDLKKEMEALKSRTKQLIQIVSSKND